MLTISHLTKYYVKSKPIISDLNLKFKETGLNLIVGKSGCGKTTLLNMIGTMDQEYIGSIKFNDEELSTLSYKKISDFRNYQSAYIFQQNSLFTHLTVKQNIKIALDLQNKDEDISKILEKVGLKGFENRKVKYLSGGERQRVGIARAIAKDAKIILADEPTSALDSKNAHQIFSLLKEIGKDRLVIIVTHDLKKASKYADRIIKLVDGRVVDDILLNNSNRNNNEIKIKKPKKNFLMPVFWNSLRKGLISSFLIILLMASVLTLTNLAIEQNKVINEYNYYEAENIVQFNALRTLTTHEANNIDYYKIIPALEDDMQYTYFQKISNREGGLSKKDIDTVRDYFKNYNIHSYNYDNLIINGISQINKFNTSFNGVKYYWDEPVKTTYDYFLYNENNYYNLYSGRLPESSNEILITDTIADAYLLRNDLDNSNLNVMLNQDLTIRDIYHRIDNYYYTEDKVFKIVGIIKTSQLNYYQYNNMSNKYELLEFFMQQKRDDPYMNTAFSQPYGYIVTMQHLDASKITRFYYDPIAVEGISFKNRQLRNNVATFHGVADYKGIHDYVDNLNLDVNNRIIVKSTYKNNLEGNEIVITTNLLRMIDSSINPWDYQTIIDKFYNELNGSSISLTYQGIHGTEDITYKIVGVARSFSRPIDNNRDDSSHKVDYYVSEEAYDQIYNLYNDFQEPSLIVGLEDANPKERIKIIKELYDLGYVLNPVNILPPGAFLEFVETQGEIEIIDDEGFSEIVNMSLYHLFSQYYNTEPMKQVNSVLEIIDSIYIFCLVMGVLISLGLIYLKERSQKSTIVKLSQLGVQTKKIIYLNIISYLLIAIITGVFTYFITSYIINYINEIFIIQVESSIGVGLIKRFRLLFTNTSLIISVFSAIITFIIGTILTVSLTYKNRR